MTRFKDLALGESFTFVADLDTAGAGAFGPGARGLWIKVGARRFSGGRTTHKVGTVHVRVEVVRLVRQHQQREGVR